MKLIKAAAMAAVLFIGQQNLVHASELEKLTNDVISMRASVEELNGELESLKADIETKLKSLGLTKVELENNIKREELKIAEAKASQEEIGLKLTSQGSETISFRPIFDEYSELFRQNIENNIPFKQTERKNALTEIENKLEAKAITDIKAIASLWQFIEDEIRISKENATHQQTITLDGKEMLADVAKLGTFALYFKTVDGRVGHAKAQQFIELKGSRERELILNLFDSLKKQIRVGVFTLPGLIQKGDRS